MGLQERLDRLERLGQEIQHAVDRREPDASGEILALREQFNDECMAAANDLRFEPGIAEDPDVFCAIQDALEVLRQRMTSHQLRWNADRIDVDPNGYYAASQPVQDLLRDFLANTRVFLRD